MPLYREFNTQEELDWEYKPEIRIADPQAFDRIIEQRVAQARKAREMLIRQADIKYGPTVMERLDIFPAPQPGAPVVVFMHGGYWFDGRLRKENYSWVAQGFVAAGVTTVIIDYDVCPKVTVDEITRSCRASLAWVHANAAGFGGDPSRIYVTGNSAGGHLTAMMAITDWENEYGLPPDLMKGGCPISGLYDLEPFQHTWLQPKIQFNGQQIRRNSPVFLVPDRPAPPLLISWGADESREFWRQSEAFGAAWAAKGHAMLLYPQEGCNHFTASSGFSDVDSTFCRMVLDHMHRCW